ncbi:MAG: hypothetical protein LVS60_16135 [Nodosilinea sp. LVE1205-7]
MLLSTDTEIRQAEVTQLRNTGAIVGGGPHLKRLPDLCHLARPNPTPASGLPASANSQGNGVIP